MIVIAIIFTDLGQSDAVPQRKMPPESLGFAGAFRAYIRLGFTSVAVAHIPVRRDYRPAQSAPAALNRTKRPYRKGKHGGYRV